MKRFLAALRFLTVLPIPGSWGTAEKDLAGSVFFFPIIGLLIGIVVAAVSLGIVRVLPVPPSAVVIVILLAAASQAFHLDGLSDTADGFLSSRPRERVLEIMRDSHVGAMGVVAIVLVLLLKVTALAALPKEPLWRAALLMPVAGRSAILVQMAILPYARAEGGLGTLFFSRNRMPEAIAAVAILGGVSWAVLGGIGLMVTGAVVLATALFCIICLRRIGGATGDTLGAGCEIAEIIPPLILCATLPP